MKVILLQDVAKIGRRYEVATVPDGYALNMLIPRRLAEPATAENLKKLKARSDKVSAATAASAADFTAALETLKTTKLEISAPLNEQNHMFEALKPAAVVESAKQAGVTIAEAHVDLSTPIKEAGEHTITLRQDDAAGEITVVIVGAQK